MEGKRIVGSPQCPSCYRDVLPGNLTIEYLYEYEYKYPLWWDEHKTRREVMGIKRTHACGHIFPWDIKMKWVMEDDDNAK